MKNISILVLWFCLFNVVVLGQSTEFTYQGSIKEGSNAANGLYDFEFRLFTAETGGSALGTLQRTNVAVVNGVFSVRLDFGAQFPGAGRFLEMAVRPAGTGSFVTLSPRHRMASSPYSIRSLNATSADSLGGVNASEYLTNTTTNFIRNQTNEQPLSNFKISGNGIIGGSVGIRTAAPSYPLTVSGNAGSFADQAAAEFTNSMNDTGVRIRNTASGGRTWTLFSSGGTSGIGAGDFSIYDATAAQSRLSINSSGNVGISNNLRVNGSVEIAGALRLAGSEGLAGQVITSNGAGTPAQWKSPTNTLYQRTNMNLATSPITPSDFTLIPGLSQTVNVSGNAKLLVQFGVHAFTDSCFGCGHVHAYLDVVLNGGMANRVLHTVDNNAARAYISGSYLLAVGAGNHTVEIKASNGAASPGSVRFGCIGVTTCSDSLLKSHLIVQVIPE